MRTWLKGLALLRFPELVRDLGERRLHLLQIRDIVSRHVNVKIDSDVRLVGYTSDRLRLGEGSRVSSGTVLAFGDDTNGFGQITIGRGSWLGQYNNLRASGGADVRIGDGCLVSQFCTLVGTNHAVSRSRPISEQGPDVSRRGIVLNDDVWLGAGVVVLPGVTIGQGAVIGANAVVTRNVPEHEIWAGVPATRIGERP